MACSGLVPLLAFYMEKKVTERVRSQLALGADAPPGPVATIWAVLSGSARRLHEGGPGPKNDPEPVDTREAEAGQDTGAAPGHETEPEPAGASSPAQPPGER